ncbi:MAG: carboxylating nicotinate-nucleotide diphosphorylase [candidate division Zixibacteria bacterium]|nr:carboxylating nicotinate-nucleotide diphosphorylase [candidate division Zixibacteria bacterium]
MERLDPSVFNLIHAALTEDIGKGDLTSLACLEPDLIRARITAKSSGILSGLAAAILAFEIVDSANNIRPVLKDGGRFQPGDTIVEIEGLNQTVFTSERTALNFLAHLSGIASCTREFVDRVEKEHCQCRVLDTRKTTPGWRFLEKMAVRHGGGKNHRLGLYDMMLIKDNHIAAAGSITEAVEKARTYLGSADYRLQFERAAENVEIEVEVTTEQELIEAIGAGVRRLLLDNQSLEGLKRLVEIARQADPEVKLEASGNVTLDNVAETAACGVDFVSIGALTHSAPASDFSLRVID